jgi:hypothetical protein
MLRNHQGVVRSKHCNSAGFGRNWLQVLSRKVRAFATIGRTEVNKVRICKGMLEVLEELGPR